MPHPSRPLVQIPKVFNCGGHQGERPGIREIFGVFGLLSWILIYITVVALPNVYTKNSHQKGGVAKWPNAFDCKSNLNVVRTFESCLLHKNKKFMLLKYVLGDTTFNQYVLQTYQLESWRCLKYPLVSP